MSQKPRATLVTAACVYTKSPEAKWQPQKTAVQNTKTLEVGT